MTTWAFSATVTIRMLKWCDSQPVDGYIKHVVIFPLHIIFTVDYFSPLFSNGGFWHFERFIQSLCNYKTQVHCAVVLKSRPVPLMIGKHLLLSMSIKTNSHKSCSVKSTSLNSSTNYEQSSCNLKPSIAVVGVLKVRLYIPSCTCFDFFSATLINITVLASCFFLFFSSHFYPVSSSITQSMDSGGTDNFILISQLKEEVMSLKRLLQQRDQTILEKDRKVGYQPQLWSRASESKLH